MGEFTLENPVWDEVGSIPRFGVLARHLRTHAHLSQSALAHSAGLSPSTVRGWEAGRSEPSMPELVRWGRALCLPETLVASIRATLLAPRAWADRPGIGVGPYLRERRLANGTTLSRTAAELGLPLATLGHYESGRVEVPTAVLTALVERFAVGTTERAALCEGTAAFLEWCDHLVSDVEATEVAIRKATHAVCPLELHDRGPAFVRLRTGLLRARLRGNPWHALDAKATGYHALWLSMSERRTEAAAALASIPSPNETGWADQAVIVAITRRYLGRIRGDELMQLADQATDPALAAWLRSEAALDLCERRRGNEAREIALRAIAEASRSGIWEDVWNRRRDLVRVSLRSRDWIAAEQELQKMVELEPEDLTGDHWYLRQRNVLQARLISREASARPAGR